LHRQASPDPTKWKQLSTPAVTSVKPIADETYKRDGFVADSSVIRFVVPEQPVGLWPTRTFVVRVCGGAKNAEGGWAIVRIPVSSPGLVRLISLIVMMLLYAGFAYAIYRVRRPEHPLAAKYPAFQPSRSFTWFEYLNPVVLTAGPFNRGSIQKLQVLLFTLLIGGMVLSLVLTLGVLSDLSRTVAMLLGISAIGAAVAQKTTSSNERLEFENWAWLVRKKVLPIAQVETPKWSDLVMTGREFDVYKLQTLIFSAVVAVALWVTGEDRLGSFAVPETLLGILGLSQIAYVAGALVRPPSVPDLDKARTELRELQAKLQLAVAHNVDVDKDGNLPMSLLAPPSPLPSRAQRLSTAVNAVSVYKKKADRIEIMLESTLETQVDRKKLEPDIQRYLVNLRPVTLIADATAFFSAASMPRRQACS